MRGPLCRPPVSTPSCRTLHKCKADPFGSWTLDELRIMTLLWLKQVFYIYGIVQLALSFPLQYSRLLSGNNFSALDTQTLGLNVSTLGAVPNATLTLSHDPVDYIYSIPNTRPPRLIQMTYSRNKPIHRIASRKVITTILARIEKEISQYGDGPIYPNPYEYNVAACYSKTIAIPRSRPFTMLTFGMLRELMMGLWTTFEGLGDYYEVFYDFTEENSIPWAEGSLLRFPEDITMANVSSS